MKHNVVSNRVALVLVLPIFMLSCLRIESSNEDNSQEQNFTLQSPNKKIKPNFKYNYGLPSNIQTKRLNTLKSKYDANKDSLVLGENYGRYLAEMKQFSSATQVFEELVYSDPDNIRFNRQLGYCYFVLGESARAVYFLKKASVLLEGTPIIKYNLFIRLTMPKHNYHSLQYNIWYLLGIAYYVEKNYDKAITCFKNSLKFASVINLKVMSSNFLYMAYNRAGNHALAKDILNSVSKISNMRSARVHLKSLQIYQKKSDPNEIATGIKKRYFKEEDFTILLYCIGNYHLLNKDFGAARMVFGRVIDEGNPYTLGYILAQADIKFVEESLLN